MQTTVPSGAEEILTGRFIASLGTENEDGSIHLTAVWYLFDSGSLYVATSSQTRKGRNVAARPKASLMVDIRKSGSERGWVAVCTTSVIAGEDSREINARIHRRYMSDAAAATEAASLSIHIQVDGSHVLISNDKGALLDEYTAAQHNFEGGKIGIRTESQFVVRNK
jgi:hypothetical protein